MALNGTVTRAAPGLEGFDTDTKLSGSQARDLHQAGFAFCLRYISRADNEDTSDLTAAEAAVILGTGLALMPVQHVASRGWMPSAALGTANGQHAAANAQTVGFPAGINVWLDLEGVSEDATAQDVIAYCNAWFAEVDGAGFVSGLYVGPQEILNGDQLFNALTTKHYWKAASKEPAVAHRGYQMIQSLHPKVAGVDIDGDVTQNDAEGDAVIWLAPAS